MALTPEQIKSQSLSALRQWGEQWREHAKIAAKYPMKSLLDFEGIGTGKACLLVANGASFEDEIETIKALQHNVDIFACDKTLGHLLNHGIKPTYVLVCDANVNYERYMEPWKDQLEGSILFTNVCANPKWVENGNWKDKYFFCVKDIIESEKVFAGISGCQNHIAAATNVSNSMIVFMTQCDNEKRQNFFGYDKYLLIGFDYCWKPLGKYYAFDEGAGGKRFYMRHINGRTNTGDFCYTSTNLAFSMQWLEQYVKAFNLPIIQCGKSSVFMPYGQRLVKDLREQMQYTGSQAQSGLPSLAKKRRELLAEKFKIEAELKRGKNQQLYDFLGSI